MNVVHNNALSSKLHNLDAYIQSNITTINQWIQNKKGARPWPIYHSLDLRISYDKICHVDSNMFPSGFNNLQNSGINKSTELFAEILEPKNYTRIMIVIENHTRNLKYFHNIKSIAAILFAATGSDIKFAAIGMSTTVDTVNGVTIYQIQRESDHLYLVDQDKWYPDFILLNNDLTNGAPEILLDIKQPITPEINNGWFYRRKSNHFRRYNTLVTELSRVTDIAPFFITTAISNVADVNFRHKTGLDNLHDTARNMLHDLTLQYAEYDIKVKPYLFLKADKGTFGRGIISVQHEEEILMLNKKDRHSLHNIKSGILNNEILIQEGINTIQHVHNATAETMLYSVNGEIAGEIIRYNTLKTQQESLNSRGMEFISATHCNTQSIRHIKWLINKIAHLACLEELK